MNLLIHLKKWDQTSKDFSCSDHCCCHFFHKVLLSFYWKKNLSKRSSVWLWSQSAWLGITSFEQLELHMGKNTERGIQQWESLVAALYSRAEPVSRGRGSAPTPQPVNLPHCAEYITPLVSLTLPFHYFFFAYESYFWSARHFFTEGIVNIRFIQLCVIFKSTQLPGQKTGSQQWTF